MIEVNIKAKGADPWEIHPPLTTWAEFQAARAAGFLLAWFRPDEMGGWKLYDTIPPSRIYEEEPFVAKYFNNPNFQIRKNAVKRVVVYQMYHYKMIPGHLSVAFCKSATRESLTAKIESLKGVNPTIVFDGTPTWQTVDGNGPEGVLY